MHIHTLDYPQIFHAQFSSCVHVTAHCCRYQCVCVRVHCLNADNSVLRITKSRALWEGCIKGGQFFFKMFLIAFPIISRKQIFHFRLCFFVTNRQIHFGYHRKRNELKISYFYLSKVKSDLNVSYHKIIEEVTGFNSRLGSLLYDKYQSSY